MTSQSNAFEVCRREWATRRVRLEFDVADTMADGVWWPYSRDLAAELAGLFAALRPGFGPIRRVIYHLDEWSTAPGELVCRGRRVRLDGYRLRQTRTLVIVGIDATLTLRLLAPAAATTGAGRRQDSEDRAAPDIEAWLGARRRITPRRRR
ncbi:DUF5994 family protein [Nocardia spumae]|uniref:DUF5994 family protein n=1 Tax=Nocardia spumae TaxID=2887190 RepID=UPI001D14C1A0|nr:DUF5994 family protein [Nocardia spumae]